MSARVFVPRGERRAFVDSSAYLALVNRRDQYHPVSIRVQERLIAEEWHLFTSNFLIAEAHGLILARVDHQVARRFLATMPQTATTIVSVTEIDESRGRDIVFQYDDKEFSLVDALSFSVMERLTIGYAFTFDRHFAQYGLRTVNELS
jgi:predicted nucleic acid-binding protein